MDLGLADAGVVVTGAARGIGAATARAFVEEGARVVLADIHEKAVSALATELHQGGGRAVGLRCDVADSASVRSLFDEAERELGALDILVANAGIFHFSPIDELTMADWDQVMAVNLRGAFLCAQAAIERMGPRRSGSVVLVASMAGRAGGLYAGADYVASKGGLIGLTKALAKQCGPLGIRVNCVSPGVIDTPMTAAFPDDVHRNIAETHPLKRWGRADEVSPSIVFLASPVSSFINGAQLDVNGGAYV